jgi:hypothetical protein
VSLGWCNLILKVKSIKKQMGFSKPYDMPFCGFSNGGVPTTRHKKSEKIPLATSILGRKGQAPFCLTSMGFLEY